MDNLTPAMEQYMRIKKQYEDCIIFFRMGDFYETFYEDAKRTAKALDIALTRRNIKNSEGTIPLAGIPYHALDSYLSKMVKQGFKVALVEQMEDPRFAKGVVKREVVRVVTPGTVLEPNILSDSNNFIACVMPGETSGISFIDITTGEFYVSELTNNEDIFVEIGKYSPSEVILPVSFENHKIAKQIQQNYYISTFDDQHFFYENARDTMLEHFGVLSLDSYGLKHKDFAVSAAGALVKYLHFTQKNMLSYINKVTFYSKSKVLQMDSTTIRNLELIENLRDSSNNSTLISVLDKTLTPMGSRLVKKMLVQPLIDLTQINERLTTVEEIMSNNFVLNELRDMLKNLSDLDRLISRINFGNSSPRDLAQLQGSLEIIPCVIKILDETSSPLLHRLSAMNPLSHITTLIEKAIIDDPPAKLDDTDYIKEGYNLELDKLRKITYDSKVIMNDIEKKERERTGIKSLKIKYNKIFGYYFDITKPNLHLVPQDYIKKQTLVNSERFFTEELKNLEEEILSAEDKIKVLQSELYLEIIAKVKEVTTEIQDSSKKLALVDVLCSFALISAKNNYCKPVVNNEYDIRLIKSRHPVVEKMVHFVSNDVFITKDSRVMIITGPNMAGKSVFMRQVALIAVMAHIGCFVPCEHAVLGVLDKLFCRTGAVDDIAGGHSTFMVEMSETAQILNNATDKSLIVLDEIGRGTSTYDGIAIAWSVAEYIAKTNCSKTLFATHYHILNNMEKEIEGVKNYNIAVAESEDKIIFLRKILEGGTDKSYGVHVARLAGMPGEVIKRSKEIQFKLEQEDEISEKIIIETKKSKQLDIIRKDFEETDRMIKSRQLKLDDL